MASQPKRFNLDVFEPFYLHPNKMKSDESRLFEAHMQLAARGQDSEFPLAIKGELSAPILPPEEVPGRVCTMKIDTIGLLHFLSRSEHYNSLYSITQFEEEGDSETYHFRLGPDGNMIVTIPNYHAVYPFHPDYVRNLVLDWAQNQFTKAIGDISASGGLDDKVFKELRGEINNGILKAVSRMAYLANAGYFIQETNRPYFVLERSPFQLEQLPVLKLHKGSFDPSNDWKTGLISFPAALHITAKDVRNAVVTAETESDWIGMDFIDCDDRVNYHNPVPPRRDLVDFAEVRNAEFAALGNAVSGMTRDLLEYHSGRKIDLSDETREICSLFTRFGNWEDNDATGDIAPTWDEALSDLASALRNDRDAFSAFLKDKDWPLDVSPLTIMLVRFNRCMERDLMHGLADVPQPPASAPRP